MKKAIRIMVLTAISVLFLFMLPGEKVSATTITLSSGTDQSGSGWTWDGTQHILTLNGANITEGFYTVFSINPSADMVIEGENTITSTDVAAINCNGTLTIKGNGKLTVTAEVGCINSEDYLKIESGEIYAKTKGSYVALWSNQKVVQITGGFVRATGGYKAVSKFDPLLALPVVGSNTYDADDAYLVAPTWDSSIGNYKVNDIVAKTLMIGTKPSSGGGTNSTNTGSTATLCSHEYEWVEDVAATADSDAKLVYKCKKCGHIDMRMDEANSAYVQFLRESADKITKASANATVKIEAKNWSSFQRTVIDALAKRPDVTLVIEYNDADNDRRQITIPAGTDLTGFIDENGYTGFDFLISKNLETDYWAGKLAK